MTEIYTSATSISPFSAILWCFYPIAVLVLVELFLGGGFDDDNDDQDGGMTVSYTHLTLPTILRV